MFRHKVPSLVRKVLAAVVLTLALAGAARAQTADEASRVRILMVIDSNAPGASACGFDLDTAAMKTAIETALREQGLDGRYTLDVLQRTDASRAKVLDYYANLRVRPSEALMFFSCSHGMTDAKAGHVLCLSGGFLPRAELRAAMLQHHPRLAVMLTNCCSNYPGGAIDPNGLTRALTEAREKYEAAQQAVVTQVAAPPSGPAGGATLRDLLFRHDGLVDITATTTGQLAFANRNRGGGFFTLALSRLLVAPPQDFDANGDGFVSWPEFFAFLQGTTVRISTGAGCPQVPEAFAIARR